MLQNTFYRITGPEDKWYKSFSDIYAVSFPVHEQRSEKQQTEAFSNEHYHLLVKIENDKLVSFIACWDFEDYVYIEHLAVNPELRGKSMGSGTLNDFANLMKKIIVLEIDPLKDEISRKRLSFYERLGYELNSYIHFHPAYNPLFEPHELLVLSLNETLTSEQYDRFYKNLKEIVMNSNSLNV